MSSPVAVVTADDGVVSARSIPDGPVRRRSFTPGQKLKYLSEYETACETGQGAAYLRREGPVFLVDLGVASAARRGPAGGQEPWRRDRPSHRGAGREHPTEGPAAQG